MHNRFKIEIVACSIKSPIRNAVISFNEMTISVIRISYLYLGKLLNGYGFCSNGRYAQNEIVLNRFIPRLYNSDLNLLIDENGILDPMKCWSVFLQNEKPGGHGDRAVAAGALDMAFWDAYAKAYEKPLWKILSEQFNQNQSSKVITNQFQLQQLQLLQKFLEIT